MNIRVHLPALYSQATGIRKKQLAWAYLQRYYPHLEPLPNQPHLGEENYLLCTYNYEKAREKMAV